MIGNLKKKITSYNFNILIISSIFIFAILPLLIKNIFFKNFFLNNIDKDNYYESLYGNSDIGCSTLKYIKPEILFIGDSMGYRNWDFNYFSKNTKLSVGTCFLQSFTEHSFVELVHFLEKKFTPKFIILSNTYRSFGMGPDNYEVVKRHNKFLKEIDQSEYEQAFKIFFKKLRGKNFFEMTIPIEINIQEYIKNTKEEKFRKFAEIIVEHNLETSGIGTYKDATEAYTNYVQIIKEFKNIKFFCDYLNKNKINLIFTNVPYSPPIYKINLQKHFKNNMLVRNYFEKCIGDKLIYTDNNDFITKNKYFVFTNFKNIDFNLFENIIDNKAEYNNLTKYYDYDHMNRYGANVFTEYWLEKNKNIFKNGSK
jgi:hypothetical protein